MGKMRGRRLKTAGFGVGIFFAGVMVAVAGIGQPAAVLTMVCGVLMVVLALMPQQHTNPKNHE